MSAKLLDGRVLAREISESLKRRVERLKVETGTAPRLVNVIVGDDHGSCAYANSQKRVAQEIGLDYELLPLAKNISEKRWKM